MRCLRCNRILRTVVSYERGYGRKCWQAVLEELRGEQLEINFDIQIESKSDKESDDNV